MIKETPYGELSDKELGEACSQRDPLAWVEFIHRFSGIIYYVIKIRCGIKNHADAEEVYQSVVIKIYNKLGTVKDMTKLRSWITTLSYNECIDYRRRQKLYNRVFVPQNDETDMSELPMQEKFTIMKEFITKVKNAFALLSPDNKQILKEKLKGSSVDDISAKLNVPKGSVHYLHKKACQELKDILAEMEISYDDLKSIIDYLAYSI